MPPADIRYDPRSYLQGVKDAYTGRPGRPDPADPLAYASGRVEGEAARLRGEPLTEYLARSRLPHLVPAPNRTPAMKTEFNAIALEDAIRAAVNVLRDPAAPVTRETRETLEC